MAKTEGMLAKFRETITRTKSALRGLGGDISELRKQMADLKAQRAVVANAPMSDDEIRAKISHKLDGLQGLGRNGGPEGGFIHPHEHIDVDIDGAFRFSTVGGLLSLGLRPLIEEALFSEAKSHAGDRGIDAPSRVAKLAKLDAEIAEVGMTLEGVLRGLEEAGVSMPRALGDDPASVLAEDQ